VDEDLADVEGPGPLRAREVLVTCTCAAGFVVAVVLVVAAIVFVVPAVVLVVAVVGLAVAVADAVLADGFFAAALAVALVAAVLELDGTALLGKVVEPVGVFDAAGAGVFGTDTGVFAAGAEAPSVVCAAAPATRHSEAPMLRTTPRMALLPCIFCLPARPNSRSGQVCQT